MRFFLAVPEFLEESLSIIRITLDTPKMSIKEILRIPKKVNIK